MNNAGFLSRMSYFGTALKALLDQKGMKAVRLAEISGVSQPTISRYIRGDQGWVAPDDLAKICGAITNKPVEQAELLRARLLDELHGPGSGLVRVEIVGETFHDRLQRLHPQTVQLPKDLEEALNVIRESIIHDPDVEDVIRGLGRLLAKPHCEETDKVTQVADEIQDVEIVKTITEEARTGTSSTSKRPVAPSPSSPGAEPKPKSDARSIPGKAPAIVYPPHRRTSHADKPRKKSS